MMFLKIKAEDAQKLADYMATRPWREAHPFMVMLGELKPVEGQLAEAKPGEAKPAETPKTAAKKPDLKTVPKGKPEPNGAETVPAEEAAEAE